MSKKIETSYDESGVSSGAGVSPVVRNPDFRDEFIAFASDYSDTRPIEEPKPRQLTAREAMRVFRLSFDSVDPWGSGMSVFFSVANELHRRALDWPDEWQYQPSILGPREPETCDDEIAAEMSDAALVLVGRAMHRYTALCDRAGLSY